MILTVNKIEFQLAGKTVNGYSANEKHEVTGAPVNYLAASELADLVNLAPSTTMQNRMSLQLKALLGEGHTTLQGRVKTTQNNYIKLTLWNTESASKFFAYQATQDNRLALNLIIALASTTLDIIIDDAFGRDYHKHKAEVTANSRFQGKYVRRTLTDALKDWLEFYEDTLSFSIRKHIYALVTDAINKGVFARTARELCTDWNCKNPRDYMNELELRYVSETESLATRLIDNSGVERTPLESVEVAISTLYIPVQKR